MTVVSLSLLMTFSAWLYSKHQLESRTAARFNAAKDRTVGLIVERMSKYEDALWSGVAAMSSHGGSMSYQDWKVFSESLELGEKYPGVNGIGVIQYIERSEITEFQKERDAEPREFTIYPEHSQEVLLPITYIEPEDINAQAIGLDVAHEENRRTALLASRDTGSSQITGPIFLVQDSGHTPGFLFYAPYYQGGVPETLEERRERFVGVVYAPFVVRKLVEGLLSKSLRDVHFSLRDAGQTIYSEHQEQDRLYDPDPIFSETVELDFYGRKWEVDVRSNMAFRSENGLEQPTLILMGGLIIEGLIIAMLVLMARSNKHAHAYAHKLTDELRAKTERLARANEEIEQFVYIASHDLKTPARGIGFLADLLEEEIVDHLGDTEARTALSMHLDMIRERVQRMNALTGGIMEFSRIGKYDDEEDEILPEAIVKACIEDFKVEKTQIDLISEVPTISFDTHNFRRVLENLIGNAFKYGSGDQTTKVVVSILDVGDFLEVSVCDNGPGISPKYHERIFEVFQTLQKAGEPESTGIGLAIVKKSIQRHGCNISVRSEEGNGAEFIFSWPKSPLTYNTLDLEKVA
ncbi:CHASE domain-containing protein [Phaeobacter gallaeciensis]|nr:CHASE domain-containing protein [Phaeobacter gallaeciensis]